MCKYFGKCEVCIYPKNLCEMLGDGSPICSMFRCGIDEEDCIYDCISSEEEMELYSGS